MTRMHASSENLAMPSAAWEAQWGAGTWSHRRGWDGTLGQAGDTTLGLEEALGGSSGLSAQVGIGALWGWDMFKALAPVLFSAHPEEDVVPSLGPRAIPWAWDQGPSSLRGRSLLLGSWR